MDLKDMEAKIKAHPEAKFMLVSHMRGKLCDMDKVKEMCDANGITMVEDCAHSVGVFWGEEHTGHHGIASCFSTQSHKAINSGEGGFLCTGDALHLQCKLLCDHQSCSTSGASIDVTHPVAHAVAHALVVLISLMSAYVQTTRTLPPKPLLQRVDMRSSSCHTSQHLAHMYSSVLNR